MAADQPSSRRRNILGAIAGIGVAVALFAGGAVFLSRHYPSPRTATTMSAPQPSAYQRYVRGVSASNRAAIEAMGGHAGRIDDPILEGCRHTYGEENEAQACARRLHAEEDVETQVALDLKAKEDAEEIRLYGAPR